MAELIRTYHDDANTKLKEEYYMVNDMVNGEYKSYYESGQLEIICNFIDDIKHGDYKEYYDNGNLRISYNIINGQFTL